MALIKSVKGKNPIFGKNIYLADNATIAGEVKFGDDCSVWFSAVVRGDVNSIQIGHKVNVQDGAVIHCTYQKAKTIIGNNVSIAHLSYVGDSEIGNNVNIGAGTITCNYDGKKKHKTIIKDNVFIGSNTSLIAPVVIESKSRIGAGSVITKNIPKNSLAIERSALKILRNKRPK